MNAFLVDLENKSGALATVAEALTAKGINITSVAGATCGDSGRAVITTADPVATREVLKATRLTFKELEITVQGRRLLRDVNIEAIFPTGMAGSDINIAFVTDNPTKAREVLGTASATR